MLFFDSLLTLTGSSSSTITIVERIKNEIKRPLSDSDVKLAIISQLRHYRIQRFHFNEAHYEFNLTEGVQNYGPDDGSLNGYPADMFQPDYVYVKSAGITWVPIEQVDFDTIRYENPQDGNNRGTPDVWAWYAGEMWFSSVPNPNAISVRIDYVRDIGIPTYEHDGSDWFFYSDETMQTEWFDDIENAWFLEAEELIRQAAKRDLYLNLYEDLEGVARMDMGVDEAIRRLRRQRDGYRKKEHRRVTEI